jgi:arylsulfatase A-like enzyme
MTQRPNILYIMADDHAAHAISAYGSRVNQTPHLDRIANGGMRFDNCFCTNSICTPSRAVILTGTHSHINGVTTLVTRMDNRLLTFPKVLQQAGYQTAIFGKWHLGEGPAHCPTGFDDWAVLPGHGYYFNSDFIFAGPNGGTQRPVPGYITDNITNLSLDWLRRRDRSRPFCLLTHHKAPHRQWLCDELHAAMYLDQDLPEPDNLQDDYRDRAFAAYAAAMRVGVHMNQGDLQAEINRNLPEPELRAWAYQRYLKAYLRVVASIDDNVGRMLDYLDAEGLTENTVVVYTSDQGFFLGDHGWFDKRFMYEESLRMPFLVRYPRGIAPGTVNTDLVANVDFAPTFLELAGLPAPREFQGRSFAPMLRGQTPPDWPQQLYYRYWMNRGDHNVAAHYGLRTQRYKLIYYYYDGMGLPGTNYGDYPPEVQLEGHAPEWELFDLQADPREMRNVADDPAYAAIRRELTDQLHRLQAELGDQPYHLDKP